MHQPETMKVAPWGEDQGEFVIINVEDFDPAKHAAFEGDPQPAAQAETAVAQFMPQPVAAGEEGMTSDATPPAAQGAAQADSVAGATSPEFFDAAAYAAANPEALADPLTAAQVAALDRDKDGAAGGSPPAPPPIPPGAALPENWRDLHWKQREKIAREFGAQPAEGENLTPAAVSAFLEALEGQLKTAGEAAA